MTYAEREQLNQRIAEIITQLTESQYDEFVKRLQAEGLIPQKSTEA